MMLLEPALFGSGKLKAKLECKIQNMKPCLQAALFASLILKKWVITGASKNTKSQIFTDYVICTSLKLL